MVKSGRKWTAVQAVTEAEASLRTKDIVGAVQDSRAGLGNNVHRWFSAQGPKGRREMVIEEVRAIDEEDQLQQLGSLNSVLGRAGKRQNTKTQLAHPCPDGATEDQLPTQVYVRPPSYAHKPKTVGYFRRRHLPRVQPNT